jgi:hypothetical protein
MKTAQNYRKTGGARPGNLSALFRKSGDMSLIRLWANHRAHRELYFKSVNSVFESFNIEIDPQTRI